MATPLGNSVSASGTGYIDGLLQGSKWSNTSLTYSLPTLVQGLSWSASGAQIFADALRTIEQYTNLHFTFTGSNGSPFTSTADLDAILTGSYLQYNFNAIGEAIFPDPNFGNRALSEIGMSRSQWPNFEGSIFYDNDAAEYIQGNTTGGAGITTILHEILHALGLKHPFDDGANNRPTYQQLGLEGADNQYFTVMSYNQAERGSLTVGNPGTPMAYDVAALQYLYGANINTNAGDSMHVFNDNGFNFTLWDASGKDWIDGSPATSPLVLNLNAGNFTYSDDTYFSIAYNTTIENAFGSYYADSITGNTANNILHGFSGADYIWGGAGDDVIHGGYTTVDPLDVSDVIYGDSGSDTLYGNGGNDAVYGDSSASGNSTDGADSIFGGIGADSLYGGGGNDSLYGGTGDDLIVGAAGNDWTSGGDGKDVFVFFDSSGYDTILDFQQGDILSIARTATRQSFSDFLGKIISDVNGSFIPLQEGSGITLAGIAQSDLDASDFYFFG